MSDFQDAFKRETRNLSAWLGQQNIGRPLYRDDIIEKLLHLIDENRSFLLVGEAGVGKSSVLQGLTYKLKDRHQQVRELSAGIVLTNTKYLGDWQTKATALVNASKKAGAVLYFTDIWNLASVGASNNDPSCLLDFLRDDIRRGDIVVAGELVPDAFGELHKTPGFVDLFERVNVSPLTQAEQSDIVRSESAALDLTLTEEDIQHVFRLTHQFKAKQPGPGPAIELLQQVNNYSQQKQRIGEQESVSKKFIDKVFSVYSGLPLFVISTSQTKPVADIRRWFRARIIGQQQAIEAVTEMIALFKAGIRDPNQPIGSFLFVGPTGVGKTEMAKALAAFLFGSEQRLLRFDMSEYKDYHSFQLLLGAPENPRSPARLLDPVLGQPFQVILFDEIEKAHPNVWDLLLQLLDEGRLSSPAGKTVDFRSSIIICTTNAGAAMMQKGVLGFTTDAANPSSQGQDISILEQSFRPEILNRFQHIVRFQPLSPEHMAEIARADIRKILQREGIADRCLAIDLSEDIVDAVVQSGFDNRYGARALKRAVQRHVALPIANYLMENNVTTGSLLLLRQNHGRTVVRTVKTEASKQQTFAEREHKASIKRLQDQNELAERQDQLRQMFHELELALQRQNLVQRLNELDQLKDSTAFWQDNQAALMAILEAEKISGNLQRLDDLQYDFEDIATILAGNLSEERLKQTDRRLLKIAAKLRKTQRELLTLGDLQDGSVLLVISVVGSDAKARDYLFRLYKDWAQASGRDFFLISEPQSDIDDTIIRIDGAYAYGYLYQEAGLHRLRYNDISCTSRVGVALLTGDESDVNFTDQQALKQQGCYGGRIRSLVRVEASGYFTLKNHLSLNENRDQARYLVHALGQLNTSDEVVRRYDKQPFAVKDYKTSFTANRKEDIEGAAFQTLLDLRVDAN